MNPFKLLDLSYLFNTRPGSEFLYFWPMLVVMVLIFVGSFKVHSRDIASRMREFSILGLLWTFFRDQNVPYLGMRFWMVLLTLIMLGYGIWYWKESTKKEEVQVKEDPAKKQMEKYLPKKKRKKKN